MAEGAHVAQRIPFNRDVLKWARERLSYAVEDAARRVNVSPQRIVDWESGNRLPSVKQGRKLAEFYDRPFLEFLAKEIPDLPEMELVPDFRFHRGMDERESVVLKEVQRWAEEQRLNALDLFEIIGEKPPKFPSELYASVDDDVEATAARLREAIDLPIERQLALKAKDRPQFPAFLRHAFERLGVLVLKQSDLSKFGTRGICLFAEPLPVIIYGNESPGAQAFTLSHELAHVLLRQSAISGQPRFGAHVGAKRVEGWCNKLASAFLMPARAITAELGKIDEPLDSISDEDIKRLANRYAVSRHAMLIRLVTLGYVKSSFYWFVKRPQFIAEEEQYKSGGRSLYYGSRYRNSRGDFYTGLVLEAWSSGRITNHNAAEFMGIKNLAHLNDIRTNFET